MALPTLSANSPSVGWISWTAFNVSYNGVGYSVPAGSTNKKWTWWAYSGGSPTIEASDTQPSLTPADLLLFLNKNGVPVLVPTASMVDGSVLVNGSVLADAIGANQISAGKLAAGAVEAASIAAGAVSTGALAANAVTADKLAANSVTADKIAANSVDAAAIQADAIDGKTITGVTITGSVLQTGTTGDRIVIDSAQANEIQLYSDDMSSPGIVESATSMLQMISPSSDSSRRSVLSLYGKNTSSSPQAILASETVILRGTVFGVNVATDPITSYSLTDLFKPWSPLTLTFDSGVSPFSYDATYMQIGKTVLVRARIVGNGTPPAGAMHIFGVPTPRVSDEGVGTFYARNSAANEWGGTARIITGPARLVFIFPGNNSFGIQAAVQNSFLGSGYIFSFNVMYEAS
jgi:hypothetical protein